MKTGQSPLAIDKHHAFVKASFPICMILPIAPILEWAVFIEREKVLLWRKKKAKPEK
jgi:hypothetical protein